MAKAPADIRSLARKHTEEALERLAYWMRSDNPKASVAAAAYLMDRGWGKAVQVLEVSGEIKSSVIRGPAQTITAETWASSHVPDQHKTH